jgi:hypothetical protein
MIRTVRTPLATFLVAVYVFAAVPARPAQAAMDGASLSVSSLTYVPKHYGGPSTYTQVIVFDSPPVGGQDPDILHISLPKALEDAIQLLTPDPIDNGLPDYKNNRCDTHTACRVSGHGTVTITYGANAYLSESFPTNPVLVTASLQASGVSATGVVTVVPKANVGVRQGYRQSYVHLIVGNIGPSKSGPLTLTISGFATQDRLDIMPPGCAWQNKTIVCSLLETWPSGSIDNQCPPPYLYRYCDELLLSEPMTWPVTLTIRVTGPYIDPDSSNNVFSLSYGAPQAGGGNSGSSTGGHTSANALSPVAAGVASAAASASPTAESPASESPAPGPHAIGAATVSSGSGWLGWLTIALVVLLTASCGWALKRRGRNQRFVTGTTPHVSEPQDN